MYRMIKIHYQKKHRIFNDDSTVNHEKKKKKKNKQRNKKTTNSNDKQQIMGGTFTDGSKWGDAIYQQTGRCSACFVQTQHHALKQHVWYQYVTNAMDGQVKQNGNAGHIKLKKKKIN